MDELEQERLALQVFGELCGLPVEQRAAGVESRCANDPVLRQRVEALIRADEGTTDGPCDERGVERYLELQIRGIAGEGAPDVPGASSRVPGHYRILGVLGEGGMATVYEAEQVHPRRQVAIKVIRGGLFSAELRRRFEYEAQVLAGLQHPGIAQLYEAETRQEHLAGYAGVQGYLAMELVRGVPIDEYAASRGLEVRGKLELILQVCDAVEYAHRMGVIHRDLKPANILVDDSGRAKVLDFGVARVVQNEQRWAATLTQGGQLVGTLPYMSPEQVDPRRGPTDTRCDIYAVGVLLYKLLTGSLPIDLDGDGIAAAVARICHHEPPGIGATDRRLRGDLEVIVAKAMEKDPERRYGSVAALADDLRRFMGGRAIKARGDSSFYVLRKAAWRYRRAVALGAVFVVLLAAFGVYASIQSARNRRLADEATKARDQSASAREVADAQAQKLKRSLYLSNIGFAQSALGNNDVARATALLNDCPGDLRGWEWRYLHNQCDQSVGVRPLGVSSVNAVDTSGDGARLAIGTADGVGVVLERGTGRTLVERRVPEGGAVAVAISPDGSAVAWGQLMDELCVVDVATGREIWRAEPSAPAVHPRLRRLRALRFSPDGRTLAAAGYDGHVRLRDAATGRVRHDVDAHCLSVLCFAFTPDGSALAGGDNTGMVRLWRTADGAVLREARAHEEAVAWVAVGPDGLRLASGGSDGQVAVRWVADWSESARLRVGDCIVWSLAFSGDGGTLVIGSDDNLVRLWRPGQLAPDAVLRGHGSSVNFVTCDPDRRHAMSVGTDASLRQWRLNRTAATPTVALGDAMTQDAAFTDGNRVLAGCSDATVRLWDVGTGAERWRYTAPVMTTIRSIAVDPWGEVAAVAEDTGEVRLLGLARGEVHDTLTDGDSSGVYSVAFSPDGRSLAAAYRSGTVRLWDPVARSVVATVPAHDGPATSVSFSRDGRRMVTAGRDGRVRLFSVPHGTPLATAPVRRSPLNEVKFSPDDARVAVAGQDGTVAILDAVRLGEEAELRGHVGPVVGLAFHPSGGRLASSGADRTIRIWDVAGGVELVTLRAHQRQVQRIAFSPDGLVLASSSADRTVRLWNGGQKAASQKNSTGD